MKRLLLPFVVVFLPKFTEGVLCRQCFNYNGQVCVNAADCQGNYCLFEEIVQNGITATKKTCINDPYYTYPDGYLLTSTNLCTSRTTSSCVYRVKICNNANYCNDYCTVNPIPTLPPPPLVPTLPPVSPTTFAPLLPGMVECFLCETFDGTDCRDGTCQGKYCLYLRQITGRNMRVKKSCVNEAVAVLDDDTVVQTTDVCEVRNTASSQYYLKMCSDQDYCNGYCNPPEVITETPQRQPMVTCYNCESRSGECFTGSCQANYCLYERQFSRSSRATYSRKGCSMLPYVEYPDDTISRNLQDCEYKTINDIDYQVRICNNGNNCNSACASTPTTRLVSCTMCEATSGTDCTGPTCTGQYCLYEHQVNQATGATSVMKSCTTTADFIYPDGRLYNTVNLCEYRTVSGIQYGMKICNSSNFCSTPCVSNPVTTALPVGAAFSSKILASMISVLIVKFIM